MKKIVFFDTEINPESGKIMDFGGIKPDGGSIHTTSEKIFSSFISGCDYICGHNILAHDLKYADELIRAVQPSYTPIDTLALSPLLFPAKPYHHLLKDDKLQVDEPNNPLNDALKARDLFYSEIDAFARLPQTLRDVFCALLYGQPQFYGFFQYIGAAPAGEAESGISAAFQGKICAQADIASLARKSPIELAYALALIHTDDRYSVTPAWVRRNYPRMDNVMTLLRHTPCPEECAFCKKNLDVQTRLKDIFGFDRFRTYDGEALQEKAAVAAVRGKSLLAIFPTGGGKSVTFQLPALIAGEMARGLTVVISPLQSLMKDQVDNLEKRGITEAVTINGLLNPIERADAMERVENGMASLLYISPESLRSNTIEQLLLSRNTARFIIDEAHCFSAWGQDFRVDYLYIGDFIRNLQEKKQLSHKIAVSCFTATAKQKVISDIQEYFRKKLDISLELFTTSATRRNLRYAVLYRENDDAKYSQLRDLISAKLCPTIVYVSRTRRALELAQKLTADGFPALPFNGKMKNSEKIANQEAFINNEVQIIVATSAFGMGVDKEDVKLVIHYDISDSLENYVQEAGRAGRGRDIQADCYVLFNDEDLDKHFILLNQTKLSISEIQQIWKAIKDLTRLHRNICRSPLEIARQAGWDESLTHEMETRVKTAIAALENAGYVERGKNAPKIYATGILVPNMEEAVKRIDSSSKFLDAQRQDAKRIIKSLISSRSIAAAGNDDAESRVDYLADRLGIAKEDVITAINLLREEEILADSMDLTAYIHKADNINKSDLILKRFARLENFLADNIFLEDKYLDYREINDQAIRQGIKKATVKDIKTIVYYWLIRGYIRKNANYTGQKPVMTRKLEPAALRERIAKRVRLSGFIVEYLYQTYLSHRNTGENSKEITPVQFSAFELRKAYNEQILFSDDKYQASTDDIQNALLYLAKIGALELEGGFLVLYSGIHLRRLALDNKIRYKNEDYKQLNEYYKLKIQQIHIVGEYAHMMVKDYDDALRFVSDYFQLDYKLFLAKYFKGNRQKEINRNITAKKYEKLFGGLSATQAKIIDDDSSRHIVVSACPGSGKTLVLARKLASLMMLEDVKHEQLLMLTFSRAAATEFKKRLISLIGGAAYFIEIRTFHSYCFELLGKIGNIEDAAGVVKMAGDLIRAGEAESGLVTKTVLVIDEAQDMDENEFALIGALMERNETMRVIVVGDDDQNIYEFRGSNSRHMMRFITEYGAARYEMMDNYRSSQNIVNFANAFARTIKTRMKSGESAAVRQESGSVFLTRYKSPQLEIPVVENIKQTYKGGGACVLTATNDEALRITGLLMKNGVPARLIQSSDGFNLCNLIEIRFFLKKLTEAAPGSVISDEVWNQAKNALFKAYQSSSCLPACGGLIETFEQTSRTKYRSDFEEFVRESKYEDFSGGSKDAIQVSTLHKSKGREFDSVYLMLCNYRMESDAAKRAVYVGITRAKNSLYIHCNDPAFGRFTPVGLVLSHDYQVYPAPDEIMLQLSHKDVVLDFFKNKKDFICGLKSGRRMSPDGDYLWVESQNRRVPVIKLSQKSRTQLQKLKQQGYTATDAEIRFIVAWKGENDANESAVILPNIYLKRL
ncbi:MAG: RecQ family ATP-dependent DNA helicase [Gracilibacteraceae bacterium]|jgi:ATP-dependent DNA helicase RecQ|nr:RecQ family ATP-dependent DNA helicase [Gracilibacteraceae bacterium]